MMNNAQTIIKFDGPALAEKKMDVADLAPSLLALSDLIKESNKKFNGDRAGIKVYVNANLEQNCFELAVHVTQTIWDHMSTLFTETNIKHAKEMLEWIGIIGTQVSNQPITLYSLIKLLKGKQIENVSYLKDEDGKNQVQLTVIDNSITDNSTTNVVSHHYHISEPVYDLYSSPITRKKAIDVLNPLREDGYNTIQFYKGKKIFEEFNKSEVPTPEECPDIIPSNLQRSNIRTIVRIRKPAYEGRSKWTLMYRRAIEASIEDEEWLSAFQKNEIMAPPNSSLDVDLEEEFITNEHGEALEDSIYRVKKVHKVILPPNQLSML